MVINYRKVMKFVHLYYICSHDQLVIVIFLIYTSIRLLYLKTEPKYVSTSVLCVVQKRTMDLLVHTDVENNRKIFPKIKG